VVYERYVKPVAADLSRIAAHQALKALWRRRRPGIGLLFRLRVSWIGGPNDLRERSVYRAGPRSVPITRETLDAAYAVIHLGGHDFHCVLRASPDSIDWRRSWIGCWNRFNTGSMTEALGCWLNISIPRV
jgi:hypothetical protein